MKVINQIVPDEDQFKAFFNAPEDGTFVMVNLLKFREKAEYADGDRGLSGAQAYMIYGAAVGERISAVGGRHVGGGAVTGLMLGEVEELWDAVGLVEYPSLEAMRNMVTSEKYQEIVVHRNAGLAGQLNIKMKPFAG